MKRNLRRFPRKGSWAICMCRFLYLHGSTDDIIPSTESLWLQREIPPKYLREVLITPAFSHVDPDKSAAWYENVRLVRFLAGVLRASE